MLPKIDPTTTLSWERLKQHFEHMQLASAQQVASAALDAVRCYANSAVQQNDLSALALVRPGRNRRDGEA